MTPGLVYDMPHDEYLADHSRLSSTVAKLLVQDGGPARARHYLDHGSADTAATSFGRLVHQHLAGEAPELVLVPGDWRTKESKATIATVIAEGKQPAKPDECEQLNGVLASLRRHSLASALLHNGAHEVTAHWDENGVACKARFDVLPEKVKGRRLLLPDLKTSRDASAWGFGKSLADYGYPQQADFYERAARACGLDDDPLMVFVAVESKAPYLVNVINPKSATRKRGAVLNDRALRLWAECHETGIWPGYPERVVEIDAPYYYLEDKEDQ
jgi:hypothetical protein